MAEVRQQVKLSGAKWRLNVWNAMGKLISFDLKGKAKPVEADCETFMDALTTVQRMGEFNVLLVPDLHLALDAGYAQDQVRVNAMTRAFLMSAKSNSQMLIGLGCKFQVPAELEHGFVILEPGLPDKDIIGGVLDNMIDSAKESPRAKEMDLDLTPAQRDHILRAAKGLGHEEAENAFALSITTQGKVSADIIYGEKVRSLKKSGLLEVDESSVGFESVGGYDLLKGYIKRRTNAFGVKAQQYGLPRPRGVLFTGISGTGKTLAARLVKSALDIPMLKVDLGRMLGSLMGESEGNLRRVQDHARAQAPCILFWDEFDKAMSGMGGGGQTDGGVTDHMLGTLLTWMQDETEPIFHVATANDVTRLPAEMFRRFDCMFFVDLPQEFEREEIWKIQIGAVGRKSSGYDLPELASVSVHFTGHEIEMAVKDGLYAAFDRDEEPVQQDFLDAVSQRVPLYNTKREVLDSLREWARDRARPATSTRELAESNGRRALS